jgi:hypothetical protein
MWLLYSLRFSQLAPVLLIGGACACVAITSTVLWMAIRHVVPAVPRITAVVIMLPSVILLLPFFVPQLIVVNGVVYAAASSLTVGVMQGSRYDPRT